MWFELFGGGLLGLHGLGMLAVHRYRAAVFWLLFSAVGWAVRLAILAMTAGIGCACVVPLSLLITFMLTLSVRRTIRRQEAGR
jgi:hypothetical protein